MIKEKSQATDALAKLLAVLTWSSEHFPYFDHYAPPCSGRAHGRRRRRLQSPQASGLGQ